MLNIQKSKNNWKKGIFLYYKVLLSVIWYLLNPEYN